MAEEAPLSYQKFKETVRFGEDISGPRYNNFYLHFVTEGAGIVYRRKNYFVRFQQEQAAMEAYLTRAISEAISDKSVERRQSLEPFESEMHEAYIVMRGYGVRDEELFA